MLSHDIILIKLKGKKAKEYVLNYMARQMRITFKEIPKEEIVLQEKGKKERIVAAAKQKGNGQTEEIQRMLDLMK